MNQTPRGQKQQTEKYKGIDGRFYGCKSLAEQGVFVCVYCKSFKACSHIKQGASKQ